MKTHLTDVVVSRLTARGTYFDTNLPAFGVRVGKNRKTWIVVRGRERIKTRLGHYPTMSLKDAREAARKMLLEPLLPKTKTLGEAYAEFKTFIADLKPRTQADYKRIMDKYFLPIKSRKLPELSYDDIMKQMPSAPSEKAHTLAVARIFFRWCVRPPQRFIKHSPLEGVQIKFGKPRERILKPEEIKPVWTAAKSQGYPHGTIVQLLLLTGQRKGEIANLRHGWINEKDKLITLPDWVTKNNKAHTFPYGTMTQEVLDTVPRSNETDLLFPSTASFERPISGWGKYKERLDKAAGVGDYTLHDIRRTYRSLHAELGTPREIGERLVNHVAAVTSDVERVYDRYHYLPPMRAAVERYEGFLLQLLVRPV